MDNAGRNINAAAIAFSIVEVFTDVDTLSFNAELPARNLEGHISVTSAVALGRAKISKHVPGKGNFQLLVMKRTPPYSQKSVISAESESGAHVQAR